MGIKTAIEWCDSTLNLQMGCDGCELWNPKAGVKDCYAGVLHERYAGHGTGYPESFDKPKVFPERIKEALRWEDLTGKKRPDKPWLNGLPRLIFLNDMGDTFTESLPIDWLAPFLPVLASTPHIYICLTKRANLMLEFFTSHRVPKNFWLLVSVTSDANYNRITQLLKIPDASVYGISYEPALGPIDITRFAGLAWIISGGQSGPGSPPSHPDWFRSINRQCVQTGASHFHKQNGEWISVSAKEGVGDFHIFPDGATVRRVGKKAAGATLDGREYREFPVLAAERKSA